MLERAALVGLLVGSFLGSAVLLREERVTPVSVATGWTDPVTTGSVGPAVRRAGGAEDVTEDLP